MKSQSLRSQGIDSDDNTGISLKLVLPRSRNPFVVRASIRTDIVEKVRRLHSISSQSLRSQGIDSDITSSNSELMITMSRNPFVVRASIRTGSHVLGGIVYTEESQSLRSQGIDSD